MVVKTHLGAYIGIAEKLKTAAKMHHLHTKKYEIVWDPLTPPQREGAPLPHPPPLALLSCRMRDVHTKNCENVKDFLPEDC